MLAETWRTDWNKVGRLQGLEDIELNDLGKIQANKTAEYLSHSDWDLIFSSPLKRALQTAEIIQKRLKINRVEIIEEFIERDFGLASGLTNDESAVKFPDGIIPNEESRESVALRVMRGLEQVAARCNKGNIIVVSHGAAINSILSVLSNGEIGSGKTVLKNCCLNFLAYRNNQWIIEEYNSNKHL